MLVMVDVAIFVSAAVLAALIVIPAVYVSKGKE